LPFSDSPLKIWHTAQKFRFAGIVRRIEDEVEGPERRLVPYGDACSLLDEGPRPVNDAVFPGELVTTFTQARPPYGICHPPRKLRAPLGVGISKVICVLDQLYTVNHAALPGAPQLMVDESCQHDFGLSGVYHRWM
jgi:hypothetical protein